MAAYLDLASVRQAIYAHLEPASASAILDVGCGRGGDLRRLGALAGPRARLVGVDASAESIGHARDAAGVDERCEFVVHDVADGLPFADGEFDRVMSVNLLECIPDRQRLLAEVHRVLAPGGRVVFAHLDWDTQLIDGDDKGLVRRMVHAFGDRRQAWMADADAWMGRRLWRTFQASGRFDGAVHPVVLTETRYEPGAYGWETIQSFRTLVRHGLVSRQEYDACLRSLEALAAADRYFYAITMFIYAGTRRAAS